MEAALKSTAQSAETVEYINCISVEGSTPSNECPRYDTKLSDGEIPALKIWGI